MGAFIPTDHAPHTIAEKSNSYFKSPSGGPLIQHSLIVMMEMYRKGIFSMEKIVEKMCHNPAVLFRIKVMRIYPGRIQGGHLPC